MTRVSSVSVLLILVAAFFQIAEARHHDSGLVLQLAGSHNSIFPDSAVWKVGEPVRVIVTMINRSQRVVRYSLTNPGSDWQMDVRDSMGNPAEETDEFREMKENRKNGRIVLSRNILGALRPSEKAQDVIEVQMFYDLSRTGEYTIQAQRMFPDVSKEPIKSNRLVLTITP